MEECWKSCQATPTCSWLSYSSNLELCLLFSECPEIEEEKDFLSSQVECYPDSNQGKHTKIYNYIHFMIYSSILFTGKVLIYSGSPYENGIIAEVVDLMNPDTECSYSVNLPYNVTGASGGKINNKHVFCGGSY